jgi:hypothetical protein
VEMMQAHNIIVISKIIQIDHERQWEEKSITLLDFFDINRINDINFYRGVDDVHCLESQSTR